MQLSFYMINQNKWQADSLLVFLKGENKQMLI